MAAPILNSFTACLASIFDVSSVTRLPIILADHFRPVAPVIPLYGQLKTGEQGQRTAPACGSCCIAAK
ncbi:hypothetical protein AGR2A_Cc30103 [Agrobacterium genomosp. 2 str. CFBP 5494]|uniref:Uncharacterized protein n=1 Tax=Agrobacterium genomosp. 2 str. CFBP 5494 TaxID=1183436 RepID=A0A9W5B1A0_9HYPH|nr:hypothetical protein AGR2A_Cc30103 [Agrobacterium genomosp. 2 str. CFBP 5494]